jgi:hypothetical protein
MTASDFVKAGIAIDDTSVAALYAESALDWLGENTTLTIDKEKLSDLPAGAKLFIMKYGEIMSADTTVASESLGGMSQSFKSESRYSLLQDLATELIGNYMVSQVKFTAAQSRWTS